MHSPIAAMLWENWQLTRVEAGLRLGLGLVGASAAIVLFDSGATIAFWILIAMHAWFWFSIAKLNGGRFMDGYKPGFPLYLLYTRPVPTVVFVGVAMVYDAVTCVLLYVASAALVGFAFGKPLPLLSVVVWLVVFHLACTCMQWSTRNRTVQWTASIVIGWPFFFLLQTHAASPQKIEFSLAENAVMVLIGLLSFGLTVAGVARQRRGDAIASLPRTAGSGGYPDWLVTLFRFRCPTSSATRAQVWFEFKSSGLPVLTIGFGVAILISLLFEISIPVAPARHLAVAIILLAVPVLLFALGGNAFGIRRKQGRTYTSAFEATQPYGTAQLAGLKVLVRTACVLVALLVIALSVWTFSPLVDSWGAWMADGKNDAAQGLMKLRRTIAAAFGGQTGYVHAAQILIVSIVVAGSVAWQAAREALRARYPRRLLLVQWLPAVWGVAMILLVLAGRSGIASPFLAGAIFEATFWISGAAMVFTAIYLLWSGIAERVLTVRYACGAVAISAAFGAALVTVLQPAGIPAAIGLGILWLVLLLLTVGVLAPWSLGRIRHI